MCLSLFDKGKDAQVEKNQCAKRWAHAEQSSKDKSIWDIIDEKLFASKHMVSTYYAFLFLSRHCKNGIEANKRC